MITLDDVSVSLGGTLVLDRISLRIARGSLTVVVGPNGAGKTTLLRAIAGLVDYRGRIGLDGRDAAQLSPRARATALAYLPQGHVFHWPITVRDAVAIGRVAHAGASARYAEAVEAAMAAADVTDFADRALTTLSGGERARVLLARALAVEAPVILADEPIAALDPAHQLAVLDLLKLRCAAGDTVVATLHDLGLAARYASAVVLLDRGRVVASGAAGQVLTDARIAEVFQVETAAVVVDGVRLVLPWLPRADLRR